jgi:psp operon transcriptional activator
MELFSGFTEKAKAALLEYEWPGNVRELKNVVERSVYRCNNPHLPVSQIVLDPFESPYRPTKRIKTQDRLASSIPERSKQNNKEDVVIQNETKDSVSITESQLVTFPVDLKTMSQNYEIDLIKHALSDSQFNQKKTADKLGLTYHQLRGYLKKYNLLDGSPEINE